VIGPIVFVEVEMTIECPKDLERGNSVIVGETASHKLTFNWLGNESGADAFARGIVEKEYPGLM
jgi:hypothetical protein